MEPSKEKRLLGVPAFLIFVVFGLSGISVALFSFSLEFVIKELMGDRPVPAVTVGLMQVPVAAWIGIFFVLGVLAAWWFEKSERTQGEVPRRSAGLVAIVALVVVLLILSGLALPLVQGMPGAG